MAFISSMQGVYTMKQFENDRQERKKAQRQKEEAKGKSGNMKRN